VDPVQGGTAVLKPVSFPCPTLDLQCALQYVADFRGARLLALGDLMLDHYLHGVATRISPEAPVPVVEIDRESYAPGGMGNACSNAASLGARVFPVGLVGEDQAAERLTACLSNEGIGTEGLIRASSRKTTLKTRLMAGSQQIARIDMETRAPISDDLETRVVRLCRELLSEVDGVMICDYAKGLLTPLVLASVIDMARSSGKPVCVDPKRSDFIQYRAATVITPNLQEAYQASGVPIESEQQLVQAADKLRATALCDYILVTLGDLGMALFGRGSTPLAVDSTARQVFDVTGAGDTAIATLSLAVAGGAPLPAAMLLANYAAGLAVEKRGTAAIGSEELAAELARRLQIHQESDMTNGLGPK
jgi:D-beta-D-heptose 7-phosphate kinase / D-beta-D-heptose 1-phosphate adenosyltransferase